MKPVNLVIRKGFRPGLDSYSAFLENDGKTPTGLEGWLRGLGVDTVVLGGLAADYCVLYSALDARALGFRVILLDDAVRSVGYPEGSEEKAFLKMRAAGVERALAAEIAGDLRQ
jgi:nicotinamidase/pyrazinamidase